MAQRAVRVGDNRVVAPDDDVVRTYPVRVVVAVNPVLRVVARVEVTDLHGRAEHARDVAALTGQKAHALVGRVEDVGEHGVVTHDVAAGAAEHLDGLRAVFLLHRTQLALADLVGFLPSDLLPLVLAAVSAVALERVQLAVLVIHNVGKRQAAQAQTALVVRVVRVAFHVVELAVLVDVHEDAAVVMAARRRARIAAHDREAVFLPRVLTGCRGRVVLHGNDLPTSRHPQASVLADGLVVLLVGHASPSHLV